MSMVIVMDQCRPTYIEDSDVRGHRLQVSWTCYCPITVTMIVFHLIGWVGRAGGCGKFYV